MFGGLRLVLAFVVALAHLHDGLPRAEGILWAVPAAVIFYVLSGYTMTALVRGFYSRTRLVPKFYLDRALRIAPQYYALLLVVVLWWIASGMPVEFFLSGKMTAVRYLQNLTILPLNYFMYNEAWRTSFIPTAWMLGAELQFYLVIPFIVLFRLRIPALAVALVVMMLAHAGALHAYSGASMFTGADVFGYRLMPGILVYFLLGSFLYDLRNANRARMVVVLTPLVVVVALWWSFLAVHGTLTHDYTRGSLLGLLGGAFLVTGFGKLKRRKLDEILGHLSYGVYLNHFLVMWALLPVLFPHPAASGAWMAVARIATFLVGSVALAWLGWWFVDNPVMRWRRRRRRQLSGSRPDVTLSPAPARLEFGQGNQRR